jgi:sugar phosphate isomerase/epimerase
MPPTTRRRFLFQAAASAAGVTFASRITRASTAPKLIFPSAAHDRINVASYPFREFIPGTDAKAPKTAQIELKDFAAHVKAKFGVNKIEPWTPQFPSTDPKYLDQFRAAVDLAGCQVINLAVDGVDSPYAGSAAERDRFIANSKKWVDVGRHLGSSSIRTHIPQAHDAKPDVSLTADSLRRVIDYASTQNVVVSLENDDPVSEDAFFIVDVIEKVQSPWLRALPDFANSLATSTEARAYSGIDAMFARACCICHVKDQEAAEDGHLVHVDMPRTFGYLKQHAYKGYLSMEWDSPGDPYAGVAHLIELTVRSLA